MNAQPSVSRFHAIVSASPLTGLRPPFVNTQFIHSINPGEVTTRKRKRDSQEDDGTAASNSEGRPGRKASVKLYDGRQQLLDALRQAFQQGPDVVFNGGYEIEEAGVSHKQRVQTLTHEIWRTTGYRFTVKDHPKITNGHKTRFWCSQDVAHKNKIKGARIPGDVPKPRLTSNGDVMAKTRYPCRSRLLISSRDSDTSTRRVVTIRIAHRLSHEPYIDSTLPPEISKSICESFGWFPPDQADNAAGPSSSPSTSHREQSYAGAGDDRIPLAVAPSQLHAPSQHAGTQHMEMEEEEDEDDDDDPGPDEDEDESVTPPEIIGDSSVHGHGHTRSFYADSQPIPPSSGTQAQSYMSPQTAGQAHGSPHPALADIYRERMRCHIANLREFCNGLEYNLQFQDTRMLETLERDGGPFLHLVEECLKKEGRLTIPSGHGAPSNGIGNVPSAVQPHTLGPVSQTLNPNISNPSIPIPPHPGLQFFKLNGVNGYG